MVPAVSPHVAFYTSRADDSSYYQNNRGRGNSYGWFGNNRGRGAFTKKGRGFHQQISSTTSSTSSPNGENRPTCQICGKLGHLALKCWHRFNNSYQYEELLSALTAIRITDVTDHNGNEWVGDSGATAHVTNSPNNLQQS